MANGAEPSIVGDVAVPLISALVGGALACVASWMSISLQLKNFQKQAAESARELLKFTVRECLRLLRRIESYRAANSTVATFDLQLLIGTFSIYERNREVLIRVSDQSLRDRIINVLGGVQTWAGMVQEAENRRSACFKDGQIIPEKTDDLPAPMTVINGAYGFLPNIIADCEGVLAELEQIKDPR